MSRYPFPAFPRGWFHVAASEALPARGVLPLRRFGRELVLWRTAGGQPLLMDGHCAHQGAHLGHGGLVLAETLKCPFHGWRWSADGVCRAVSGASAVPAHRAQQLLPLAEQDGALFAWHGPTEDLPAPPPRLPELAQGWVDVDERAWIVASHVQEVVENLVDAAHFPGLHLTPSLPRTRFTADGLRARVHSEFRFDTLAGPVPTTLESEGHGPGWWALRFTAPVPMLVLTTATPHDQEQVEFRLRFVSPVASAAARAFADSVILEVEADRRVWEHKLWREDPPLSEADGPVAAYRAWFRQFLEP
ncbi:MAG TPA: Rieske 2Fe-2S domain-containing protein [Planctomycetota bacterium]|nr:Rieske 2Fe-2S domain-containing protein [Planctomycetota bacterium]